MPSALVGLRLRESRTRPRIVAESDAARDPLSRGPVALVRRRARTRVATQLDLPRVATACMKPAFPDTAHTAAGDLPEISSCYNSTSNRTLPVPNVFNALLNPHSFWREILRYGWLDRKRSPESWFAFRHAVGRECAIRRRGADAVAVCDLEVLLGPRPAPAARLIYESQTPYNLSWEELVVISQLAATVSPHTLFEFGTFNGRTTLHLALNSPDEALVYTLDIKEGGFDFGVDTPFFKRMEVGECFRGTEVERKIRPLLGDSQVFDFTRWSGTVDLVFIDGDHSYDGVIRDSLTAFDLVRPGGLILWHDYLVIGDVTRALAKLGQSHMLMRIAGTSLVLWRDER